MTAPELSVRARYALAALGGALCFLGYTSFGLRATILVCLVPVLAAVDGVSGRRTLGIGLAFGLTMNLLGYHWILYTMRHFGGFPLPVAVILWTLLCAYQGGQLALIVWLQQRLVARGNQQMLAVVVAVAAAERLYPLLFPAYLGAGLHELPLLQQTADVGGPVLVSTLAAAINVGLYQAWRRWRAGRRIWRPVLTVAGILAIASTYGLVRTAQLDRAVAAAPSLRVGLVQAAVGIEERAQAPVIAHREHLRLSLELQAMTPPPDLIVWPESGYHFALPDGLTDLSRRVTGPALHTPVLFGAGRVDHQGRQYNTAYLVDGAGQVLGTYDKTYLLMFGEYLPFGERWPELYRLSPATAQFYPGTHLRPMPLGPYRITVLVCYEDLLPDFTRRAVRSAAPHLLVNLTNDAWFGDGLEPDLHLALARLRAIEQRRFLVRATNTGVSAVVDPTGQITVRGGVGTRETLIAEVAYLEGQTLFARIGDLVGWGGVVVAVWLGWVRRRTGAAAGSPDSAPRVVD